MNAISHKLSLPEKIEGALRFPCTRIAGYPTLINLEVTRRCNARCGFCRYWPTRTERRLDDYVPVIRKLKPTVVVFTGGEPLMRPDLERLIVGVRRAFPVLFLGMVTNGALLTVERGISLWNAGLDQIAVSLDYLDERHDDARCIPGLTRRILDVLPRLVAEGIDNIALNTVIKADNIDSILDIVEWAAQNGVKVSLSAYTSAKNGNKDHLVKSAQLDSLRDLIDKLVSLRKYGSVIASSTYYLEHIPEYFANGGIGGCKSGKNFVTVGPGGEVYRCSESQDWCYYEEWTRDRFAPTDCGACWVSCRGESQAPLNWERVQQVVSHYKN